MFRPPPSRESAGAVYKIYPHLHPPPLFLRKALPPMADENFVPYYETFGMYLARQKDRDDPIGDLAKDFLRDPPDADPVTWQSVLEQIRRRNGCSEAEIALRWAKGEYLAMDQAMKEYEADELGVDFDK